MLQFLPLIFSIVAANPTPTQWYQQPDLSEYHLNSVINRDCFRGTYGDLSLFTCPLTHVHIEPFAEISNARLLCVVETVSHEEVLQIAKRSTDVEILFNDNQKYLILASVEARSIYPQTCFRDAFRGAAFNVYTVPNHSFRPSTLNVLAGKEKEYNDVIADFIALVDANDLEVLDTSLAFGPRTSPDLTWNTRNSYSQGSRQAVEWARHTFASTNDDVTLFPFRDDMCSNIIAEYKGTDPVLGGEIIVFGAHLDSRGQNNSSPTDDAPGADDNGTGTSIALLFARLVDQAKILFRRTVRVQTFCGEEQGLVGSRAIATNYKNNNVNVVAMYNADMVGYQPPGNATTIAFMNRNADQGLTTSCMAVAQNYLPNTAFGYTSACCSDQQAYYENGFSALGVFETPTSSVIYPHYHNATDTPDKVSFPQVALFAQAIYACLLTAAM